MRYLVTGKTIVRDIQLPLDAVVDKFNNTRQKNFLKWLDCV